MKKADPSKYDSNVTLNVICKTGVMP